MMKNRKSFKILRNLVFVEKKEWGSNGISRSAISVLLAKQKDIFKKMDSSVLASKSRENEGKE